MLEMSGGDSSAIEGTVYEWYRRRGVLPRWVPGTAGQLVPIGRPLTDAEVSRAWLRDQVAPVVARLREWYSEEELYVVLFRSDGSHASAPVEEEGGQERAPNHDRPIRDRADVEIESAKPTRTE
jgi:hypothetical protein